MSDLYCPHCEEELTGGNFGDDAYCKDCGISFETDWDYTDFYEGCTSTWLTGKEYNDKLNTDQNEQTKD